MAGKRDAATQSHLIHVTGILDKWKASHPSLSGDQQRAFAYDGHKHKVSWEAVMSIRRTMI